MIKKINYLKALVFFTLFCNTLIAQTDIDALMMPKQNFCGGIVYGQSSWKNYWEGTFKRDNQNLGNVSTSMVNVMGNYGITDKLNLLFGVPSIQTKASAGTLKGQKGIQDLSLTIKYMPIETDLGIGTFSLYTIGSVSTPLTNYVADFLPLSIGLHSSTATARLMVDYQINQWFATASAAYIGRKNITIDRTAYYTNQMHYSNEVSMPDATNINVRMGYRTSHLIAEAIFDQFNTQGGFDIRKNDMPFPSNEMNAKRIGVNVKYTFHKKLSGLSAIGGGNYVLDGRNVGQSYSIMGGVFYQMDWTKKKKKVDVKK
jgi:hypothetical protein